MTRDAWNAFERLRDRFRADCARWNSALPGLRDLQDQLRARLGYDDYEIETPVVYNRDLDALGPGDRVAWILVADNPGKKEQLEANRRYLVGQAGKLAARFFREELALEFRREVLVINKTPIHTPKTAELRKLLALDGDGSLRAIFEESQESMARLALDLARTLDAPIWISGLGELSPRGVFSAWSRAFGAGLEAEPGLARRTFVFRHFSMNQFAVQLKGERKPGEALGAALERIGAAGRLRAFGA
ncbi:MAG: hypothetical protein JXA15_03495 [Spirochaetales bacterium]|nr:hypothetical protein [Spirochaetales bacterium]